MAKQISLFYTFLKQALPLMLSQLVGAMGSLITMYYIAHLGGDALAAGALMSSLYGFVIMIVMALFFSISGMVAYHRGQTTSAEVGKIVFAGLILAFILTIPLTLLFHFSEALMLILLQPEGITHFVGDYFRAMSFGILPTLILFVLHQYLMGVMHTRIILCFSILGVVLNAFLSYLFIFDHQGAFGWGVYGAGLANVVTSYIMLLSLVSWIQASPEHERYALFSFRSCSLRYLKQIFQVGLPISIQYGAEIFAFTFLTILIGWFGSEALAAQQIAMQYSLIAMMLTAGISQTATVMMGQAMGRGAVQQSIPISNLAYAMGFIITITMLFICVLYPSQVVLIYAHDNGLTPVFMTTAINFIFLTALTQVFDAVRNIAAGILRGMNETRASMWTGFLSCWLVGIPLGSFLAFNTDLKLYGLRIGMMIAIAMAAFRLLILSYRESRHRITLGTLGLSRSVDVFE